MKTFLCYLFIFSVLVLHAQTLEKPSDRLFIESFSYPEFDKKYEYGNFTVGYNLSDRTALIVNGLRERTPASDIFEAQLLVRRKLLDKVYALGGVQYQWDFYSANDNPNTLIINQDGAQARKELLLGIEYHPKPNIELKAEFLQLLNSPRFAPRGFNRVNAKSLLRLGSKFKF